MKKELIPNIKNYKFSCLHAHQLFSNFIFYIEYFSQIFKNNSVKAFVFEYMLWYILIYYESNDFQLSVIKFLLIRNASPFIRLSKCNNSLSTDYHPKQSDFAQPYRLSPSLSLSNDVENCNNKSDDRNRKLINMMHGNSWRRFLLWRLIVINNKSWG